MAELYPIDHIFDNPAYPVSWRAPLSMQAFQHSRNTFGEVVAEYTTGVSGEVAGYRTDATSEPGNMLVFVLHNRNQPDRTDPYPE